MQRLTTTLLSLVGAAAACEAPALDPSTQEQADPSVPGFCGNAVRETGEACDDGGDDGDDYTTVVDEGFADTDGCTLDCQLTCLEMWTRTYASPLGTYAFGTAVAVDRRDNVLVLGREATIDGAAQVWLRKYDPDGQTLWTRTYDGTWRGSPDGLGVDYGNGVAAGPDGSVVIVGSAYYGDGGTYNVNLFVRKYDADGNLLWTQIHDGPDPREADAAYAVAIDDAGDIAVAGNHTVPGQLKDIWVAKYDAGGRVLWERDQSGPAVANDSAQAVAIEEDGAVVVGGFIDNDAFVEGRFDSDRDLWVRKYDKEGDTVWTYSYAGRAGLGDWARALSPLAGGDLLVVGREGITATDGGAYVARLSPDGRVLWSRTERGQPVSDREGRAGATDAGGVLLVAGVTPGDQGDSDIWLRKYDAQGAPVWTHTYDAEGLDDQGYGVAADSQQAVIAVGYDTTHADGSRVWVRKCAE